MVYFMENPSKKWMIWGYPYFRKPQFDGFPSYGSKSESLAEISDGFSDRQLWQMVFTGDGSKPIVTIFGTIPATYMGMN